MDSVSWTPELQKALNYDRKSALQIDNGISQLSGACLTSVVCKTKSFSSLAGVFWISWECVMQFFDVIYMNWNPKLFKYRYSLHS